MKSGVREHSFSETAPVLALFFLFALFALLLALFGARVYKGVSADMQANYELRASLTYVAGKLRSSDAQGGCGVDSIGGVNAIVLRHEYNGSIYKTYIYYFDGMLRELFVSEAIEFDPAMGIGIAPLSAFTIGRTESGVTIGATCADGRASGRLTITQQSMGAVS